MIYKSSILRVSAGLWLIGKLLGELLGELLISFQKSLHCIFEKTKKFKFIQIQFNSNLTEIFTKINWGNQNKFAHLNLLIYSKLRRKFQSFSNVCATGAIELIN